MALFNQHLTAQKIVGFSGHATRAGATKSQPDPFGSVTIDGGYPFPKPPTFEDKLEERAYLKGRLAAAYRIFGQKGYDEGVAGHISVRDPIDRDTMWLNPFGIPFAHMRASDLIRVDHQGKVLDGGAVRLVNRAAVLIHAALHEARPDINCAAHAHPCHGRAFSILGRPLPITSQDGCAFYNDLAYSGPFEGIVLEGGEGVHIAEAIGSKKAIILRNHGLVTCADTVEAAVFWFVTLEKLCQTHLLALAAVGGDEDKIVKVGETEAANSFESLGKPISGWFSAKPLFDIIAQETHEAYLA